MRISWLAPSVLRPVTSMTGITPVAFSGNTSGMVTPKSARVLRTPSAGCGLDVVGAEVIVQLVELVAADDAAQADGADLAGHAASRCRRCRESAC